MIRLRVSQHFFEDSEECRRLLEHLHSSNQAGLGQEIRRSTVHPPVPLQWQPSPHGADNMQRSGAVSPPWSLCSSEKNSLWIGLSAATSHEERAGHEQISTQALKNFMSNELNNVDKYADLGPQIPWHKSTHRATPALRFQYCRSYSSKVQPHCTLT